ncbi:thiol-disulfide isomerase/thioredoxin [Mucilaginibacter rubeus]|uniref:TlpA family protein disulfide reductase n=1 Tax=Mucilaginibacter rubeus TaxID=2027860 RepID=UPI003396F927
MKSLLTTFLIFIALNSFAQYYHPLKIGDQIPDVTIRGFFDDSQKSVKISELYRNKLLILDFWGTWCGACLEEMGTFPHLKAQFRDQIEIVAVGYEAKEKIAALFKRNPSLHSKAWITLYSDSVLTYKLFPHHLLPHMVWIDRTGHVIAITEGYDLSADNIKNAISGRPVAARLKTDENSDLSIIDKPFRQMDTNFIGRSILTKRMPGSLSFESMHPATNDIKGFRNRTFEGNCTLRHLYFYALFYDGNPLNESRLVFELNDSLRFTHPKKAPQSFKKSKYQSYDDWADSNLYCYELIVPKLSPDSILRKTMLADLNRYLNLNGRWEMRDQKCYAIQKRDKSEGEVDTKNNTLDFYKPEKKELIKLDSLVELFNKRLTSGYVINKSGLPNNTFIETNTSFKASIGQAGISNMLKRAGLTITLINEKIPIYVVSEY